MPLRPRQQGRRTRSPGSSSGSATAPCQGSRPIRISPTWSWSAAMIIVPMARLDDTTRVGNETGYADEFDVNGPYFGALDTSHFFSDDPYGDLDPVQWATRRLYVPELAIGRLVESPDQIIAQTRRVRRRRRPARRQQRLCRRIRLHDRRRQFRASSTRVGAASANGCASARHRRRPTSRVERCRADRRSQRPAVASA